MFPDHFPTTQGEKNGEVGTRGNSTFVKGVILFLERLNNWIENTADDLSIPFIDIADAFRDPDRPLFLDGRWSCGDHAHLGVDGYRRMAQILYDGYFCTSPEFNIVVCLGDSLTQGYPGRATTERNGLPIDLDRDSQSQFPFWLAKLSGKTFINRGIAGNTVYGMRTRFDREVVTHLPDHCLILGGTNDALIGTPLEDTCEDLYWLYNRCVELEIIPVCGSVIPLGLSEYY